MISAVLLFGAINVLFEFVLLCMIPPRLRLRVLGSERLKLAIHIGFLIANLCVHWGTIVGTMSAILAFVCSLATVKLATWVFGTITDGRHYTTGLIKYSAQVLR